MAYQIRTETLKTFVTDKNIKLPRFQRKQTWKRKQNFELLISVFKQYPIGVTIINTYIDEGRTRRFLLDGRQRRNALQTVYYDPNELYNWSKALLISIDSNGDKIKIKKDTDSSDIDGIFWAYVNSYINPTDEESYDTAKAAAIENNQQGFEWESKWIPLEEDDDEDVEEKEEKEGEEEKNDDNEGISADDLKETRTYKSVAFDKLESMLEIIKLLHKGYLSPLDFRKSIPEFSDRFGEWNTKNVTKFLRNYRDFCEENDLQEDENGFFEYLKSEFPILKKEDKKSKKVSLKTKNRVSDEWVNIKNCIDVILKIESIFETTHIGEIETSSITSTDAQMIFTLINNNGAALSAVEILSAKPAWNRPIKNPSINLKDARTPIYKAIGQMDNNLTVVRWDYPATIYNRLKDHFSFLFSPYKSSNPSQLQKMIALGFKILAGIYNGGIKREDQDSLTKKKLKINWEKDIDLIIADLSSMGKVIGEEPYFKFLKSWGQNIMSLTSEAVALNFLFICYLDYVKKGKPSGRAAKAFSKNALILIDSLMYEYIKDRWRGTSDARISSNIKKFNNNSSKNKIFDITSDDDWMSLLKGINDHYQIDGKYISYSKTRTLTYHIFSMQNMGGDGVDKPSDMDHIIPQSQFNNSTLPDKQHIQHALFNLCPLPTKDNIKKSDKALKALENAWLIKQVERLAGIKKKDFETLSDCSNYTVLRKKRRGFFEKDFIKERQKKFTT